MKLFFTFVCFLSGSSFSSLLPAVTGQTVPSSEGSVRGHVARELPSTRCDCAGCDASVLNTMAGGHSCDDRIDWVKNSSNMSERQACMLVAGHDYPDECGRCNPDTCGTSVSVGTVSATASSNTACGCSTCTETVFDTDAGGYKCGDRIEYLQNHRGYSEPDACTDVAEEFQAACGECNPDLCDLSPSAGGGGATPPAPPAGGGGSGGGGGTVKVMSYNTEFRGYYENPKVPQYAAKIIEVQADVVGVQECQDPDHLARLSGYTQLPGTGRQNYIFYNPSRVEQLASGMMDIPRDEHADRAVTWGKFRVIEDGNEFWFFNTHLPHPHGAAADRNTHSRIAKMIIDKRNELGAGNTPTVIVCDCNPFASAGASEGSFETNLGEGGLPMLYTSREPPLAGFDKIFVSQGSLTGDGADDGPGGSDHGAISADLTFI